MVSPSCVPDNMVSSCRLPLIFICGAEYGTLVTLFSLIGDGRHLRQPADLHREGVGFSRRGPAAGASAGRGGGICPSGCGPLARPSELGRRCWCACWVGGGGSLSAGLQCWCVRLRDSLLMACPPSSLPSSTLVWRRGVCPCHENSDVGQPAYNPLPPPPPLH